MVIRILEVIGGILLKVGLVIRITLILFIIEMIRAIIIVKAGNNFMTEGGYEVDLLLMFISIHLLLPGPGRVSRERDELKHVVFTKIFCKKNENSKAT